MMRRFKRSPRDRSAIKRAGLIFFGALACFYVISRTYSYGVDEISHVADQADAYIQVQYSAGNRKLRGQQARASPCMGRPLLLLVRGNLPVTAHAR